MPSKEAAQRITASLKRQTEERKAEEAKRAEYRERGIKQLRNAASDLLLSEGHPDLDGVYHCHLVDLLNSLSKFVESQDRRSSYNPVARETSVQLDAYRKVVNMYVRI